MPQKFKNQIQVGLFKLVLRRTCCLWTVGQVVHSLPEGEAVWGVTSLADEVYVLRDKEREQVEVYDVINYSLQRHLSVPNIRGFVDMTSCEHYRCVYIANNNDNCIHGLAVDVPRAGTWWCVNDQPAGLSVNVAHNVLVTCPEVGKIKEYSSRGDLVREISLPDDVNSSWHAIQLTNGQFIVCHGDLDDPVRRVCKINTDGHDIVQSHGGRPGPDIGQYRLPSHLAVDDNEFVFVVDIYNKRVTLLSATLDYVRQVVSHDTLKWWPGRLYLDAQRRRLYVTENECENDEWRAGRVIVFSV